MNQNNLLSSETNGQETKHQLAFLNKVFLFAGIVAFGMGFIRWQVSAVMGMLDFGFAGLAFALLFYLRQHKEKIELISSIALVLSFMLFFAIFLLAPYNTTRSSLFFLLSASAFFLKGRRAGFLWLIFILLSIVSVSLFSSVKTAYSLIDILTMSVYLIALFFVFESYEAVKEGQQERVVQLNMQLEEKIQERTRELQQANQLLGEMNEQLDEKVKERTQQLLDVQEELVRREKLALLGQVADTVGHELRNPLGVMNNAVYFLQAVLTDADETTREYLGIIKDEIADAERIVSDLLDAVRTKPPHPEMIELAELMQQTLRKCNVPSAVSVLVDIPASLPAIRVDPVQMRQVFWNLITNGVEAMPGGGVLKIGAVDDPVAKTVIVSVEDSGRGIAPEHQSQLFQPMFTTKARRVGLGLVVVKNLTEVNGGSVGVESELGKGSVFTVTLPGGA